VPLRIVRGDATSPRAKGPKLIAHICNDLGGWGKGFVLAVSRRRPEPEQDYRRWHRERAGNNFGLGAVQVVRVRPDTWVANMIGQHGMRRGSADPPIRACTCPGSAAAWPAAPGNGSARWSKRPCPNGTSR
jgi:O-acetyl-ADP-ribose deacetylase (regulator of RNase III)